MASWRERYAWWREFRYLGARDVKRRVEHLTWAQEKRREAERFLLWHANWLQVLGMVNATLGMVGAAPGGLVALPNYLPPPGGLIGPPRPCLPGGPCRRSRRLRQYNPASKMILP